MAKKSPVDELVDGIDAIGSILDENLPQIKSRLIDLSNHQAELSAATTVLKASGREVDENMSELRKAATNQDVRIEEILSSIGALGRRLDQIQKTLLEMVESIQMGGDSELIDAVKTLEDRVRKLESDGPIGPDNFRKRF